MRKNDNRLNEQKTNVNGKRNNNYYCWASPSSGDAYRDRQLTPNYEH